MPKPKPIQTLLADSQPEVANLAKGAPQKPDKWWKWLLLYPTLVISILSSIPTYIELIGSRWLNVPYGQYKTAVRENELWKENIQCAAAPFDGLKNSNNIEVDAVICQSGAVLVRVKPPEKNTAYKWVPLDTQTDRKVAFSIFSTAHAQAAPPTMQIAQANYSVICQQWIGNGIVRRRIHDRNTNRCTDEVVNTFNGQVISTNPAPCNCQ